MFLVMRNTRQRADSSWISDRTKQATKSRKYMLWSFFTQILTAITDTKDWKALLLKSDPAYVIEPEYWTRTETNNTTYKVRFRS